MQLLILNRQKKIYEGEVRSIYLPGESKGDFQMLENHMPIVVALKSGDIVVKDIQDKEHTFSVEGGMVESNNNTVTILAE